MLHAELAQRLGDLLAVVGTAAPPPADDGDEGGEDSSTATERPVVSDVTAAASATRLVQLLDALEEARFIDVDGGLDDLHPADLVGARFVVGGGSGAKLDNNALVLPHPRAAEPEHRPEHRRGGGGNPPMPRRRAERSSVPCDRTGGCAIG